MKAIWKYKLEITDNQTVSMPRRSVPLFIGVQNNQPVMWVRIETTLGLTDYKVRIIGTGHKFMLDNEYKYRGTFQVNNSGVEFVGHVFVEDK